MLERELELEIEAAGLDLEMAVVSVLRGHPAGLSEFAFFAALERAGFRAFARDVFSDRLRMFRSHFALFHVLYVLRERFHAQGEGTLTIEALHIQLTPRRECADETSASLSAEERGLVAHDALAAYYLDRTNLTETTDDDVLELLDSFWSRFAAIDRQEDSLALFGLTTGATWHAIKARYRALVLEHHPDRGGDAAKLAEVNAAMRVLATAHRSR